MAAALAVAAPAKADIINGIYSHSNPNVSCNTRYNGYGQVVSRTITADSPLMISPRDTQQVS